mgnify:CR=1 FL=1
MPLTPPCAVPTGTTESPRIEVRVFYPLPQTVDSRSLFGHSSAILLCTFTLLRFYRLIFPGGRAIYHPSRYATLCSDPFLGYRLLPLTPSCAVPTGTTESPRIEVRVSYPLPHTQDSRTLSSYWILIILFSRRVCASRIPLGHSALFRPYPRFLTPSRAVPMGTIQFPRTEVRSHLRPPSQPRASRTLVSLLNLSFLSQGHHYYALPLFSLGLGFTSHLNQPTLKLFSLPR